MSEFTTKFLQLMESELNEETKVDPAFYRDGTGECEFELDNVEFLKFNAYYDADEYSHSQVSRITLTTLPNQSYPTYVKEEKLPPEQAKKEFEEINSKIAEYAVEFDEKIKQLFSNHGYKKFSDD